MDISNISNNNTNETSDCLAKNISKLLEIHQINENELAKKLGIPYNTIHRILTGTTSDPRISTLQQIADYFGVTLDFLLHGKQENDMSNPKNTLSIPVLNWEIIIKPDFVDNLDIYNKERSIKIAKFDNANDKSQLFALESTKSMHPRFPTGTTFIFNAKGQASDGDLVLVRFRDNNAVSLRELIIDSPNWQLTAIVSGSAPLIFTYAEHEIIGVVILTLIHT